MTNIKISKNDDKTISVDCPYHPDTPKLFRNVGGKFDKVWVFDERDGDRVKNILEDIFGTHDSDSCVKVDVRLAFDEEIYAAKDALYLAGRQIARATGRDSCARIGEGVIVIEGKAPYSGGSAKNWATIVNPGTVLEIRDLPKAAADKLAGSPPSGLTVSIAREAPEQEACVDVEALKLRRAELLSELAEIEALIGA